VSRRAPPSQILDVAVRRLKDEVRFGGHTGCSDMAVNGLSGEIRQLHVHDTH
jgi:hypothetical protein